MTTTPCMQSVGIKTKGPKTSVLGVGHEVLPGTVEFAIRDGGLPPIPSQTPMVLADS